MVLYKNNSTLKYRVVVTYNGEKEYLKNCRRIDGSYYVIKKDCVKVGDKWYKTDDNTILKDYETGEYFLKTNITKRVKGIVEIKDNNIIEGYFTPNECKNVRLKLENGTEFIAISTKIFNSCKHIYESISEGVWYYNKNATTNFKMKMSKIVNVYDWTVKRYNIEENREEYKHKIHTYNKYPHEIELFHNRWARFLHHTFGVEFEVAAGFIPDHLQYRHGVVACRDGSIHGGAEFVTIPLSGEKGLSSIHRLCSRVKDRVNLDIHCSTHIHLGGYPFNEEKLVSLYLLCRQIQGDIFDMLPPYKRHWEGFKNKNYCRELDKLGIKVPCAKEKLAETVKIAHEKVFNYLSDFKLAWKDYKAGLNHPSGAKWDVENRKSWVNLINMYFSKRGTIEFRAHQATFNPTKIINWLFINNAILRYADINSKNLHTGFENVTLEDVLDVYTKENPYSQDARFLSSYLKAYFRNRKDVFTKAFKNRDFVCNWDLDEDKSFTFQFEKKDLIS